MSRKLAAVIATSTAAILVFGSLIALAVGRSNPPQPTVASNVTPMSPTPTPTPTGDTGPGKGGADPDKSTGTPAGNPTATAAAGNKKVLFFSFDDGPDPVWTPRILQVLAKHGAPATFELGMMQAERPGPREQILAAGNTIGNHTITHPQLTALPAAKRHHEIFDGPTSKCFRPAVRRVEPEGARRHQSGRHGPGALGRRPTRLGPPRGRLRTQPNRRSPGQVPPHPQIPGLHLPRHELLTLSLPTHQRPHTAPSRHSSGIFPALGRALAESVGGVGHYR